MFWMSTFLKVESSRMNFYKNYMMSLASTEATQEVYRKKTKHNTTECYF